MLQIKAFVFGKPIHQHTTACKTLLHNNSSWLLRHSWDNQSVKADKGEREIVILLAKAPHISDFSGQAEVSAVATRKTATNR